MILPIPYGEKLDPNALFYRTFFGVYDASNFPKMTTEEFLKLHEIMINKLKYVCQDAGGMSSIPWIFSLKEIHVSVLTRMASRYATIHVIFAPVLSLKKSDISIQRLILELNGLYGPDGLYSVSSALGSTFSDHIENLFDGLGLALSLKFKAEWNLVFAKETLTPRIRD